MYIFSTVCHGRFGKAVILLNFPRFEVMEMSVAGWITESSGLMLIRVSFSKHAQSANLTPVLEVYRSLDFSGIG